MTWRSSACRCASPSTVRGWSGPTAPPTRAAFDVAYLANLPGFVVMAAADEAELVHMVATAAAHDEGPIAFRYPRGEGDGRGHARPRRTAGDRQGPDDPRGPRVAILSFGTRLGEVLKACEALQARGITPTVADARFAKPLDRDLILRLARDHEALITIEEGAVGGFGQPRGAAAG